MDIRNIRGGFPALNRKVADLHLKAQGNDVKTSQFNPPTCGPLKSCDEAAADHLLERVGVYIPEQSSPGQQKQGRGIEQVASDPAQPFAQLAHCPGPCTNEGSATNMRIWDCVRKLSSQ